MGSRDKQLSARQRSDPRCHHQDETRPVRLDALVCAACVVEGSQWVHLRVCLTCGHVGCCDFSAQQHATAHAERTGHPLIMSAEPGERWAWCYPDAVLLR